MISRLPQKSDSLEDIEAVPLRSLSSFSGSASLGNYASSTAGSVTSENDNGRASFLISDERQVRPLFNQALIVITFGLMSWHVPRFLIESDSSIDTTPPPFQILNDGQVVLNQELTHPLIDPPTVPSALLVGSCVYLPFLLVPVIAWLSNLRSSKLERIHHCHAAFCAFCTAISFSEGPTQLLKLYLKRPRPNFYALCGFDAASRRCTADLDHVREAYFSFPSGHSSLAASTCVFLVWFISGAILGMKTKKSSKFSLLQRRLACAMSSVVLLACAIFVAASRLHDYWHHYADVLAGLCLGGLSGTLAYHAWYPPIWSPDSGGVPFSLMEADGVLEQLKKDLSVDDY